MVCPWHLSDSGIPGIDIRNPEPDVFQRLSDYVYDAHPAGKAPASRCRRPRPGIVGVMSATSDDARATCTPCRGTGKLISGLGGEPHEVTCPWCGGTGEFQAGRDAQQAGRSDAGEQPT
jgi:hypothetical protein